MACRPASSSAAGSLEGQPARLVVPGQPRGDPLALRRIVSGLPVQAGPHPGVHLRPFDRVQLIVQVLLKQVMREPVA